MCQECPGARRSGRDAAGDRARGSLALRLASWHLLFLTNGTSAPAESLCRGTPVTTSPSPGDVSPGFSIWLARYLRDLHLLAEPPPRPRARAPGPRPLPAVCGCRTPPRPLGPQDPGPAPPPWPRRSVPGGGAARSGVSKAGGARQGAGRPRRRPISAAITSMQIRAQWSEPITRPCKQA